MSHTDVDWYFLQMLEGSTCILLSLAEGSQQTGAPLFCLSFYFATVMKAAATQTSGAPG